MTRSVRVAFRTCFMTWTLGFALLSGTCCKTALAISAAPSWKFPALIYSSASYDNQRGNGFLAYDHYGVPSAVTADSLGSVQFARQVDGHGWLTRSIGGAGAKHASIAFDRRELPAIAYGDSNGLNYTYYSPSTGNFVTSLVNNTAVSGIDWTLGTSVAFDVNGRPAIAASEDDGVGGNLHYVSDTNLDGILSAADVREFVASDPEQFPSLVFDGQNRPYIANRYLSSGSSGDFDLWTKDPFLGWRLRIVTGSAEPGTPDAVKTSIAIDPTDGLPAIAWTNWTGSTSDLWYGKWDPNQNSWNMTLVTSSTTNQLGNESLAFDPADGRPAIAYGDSGGEVNFAWFNGTTWNTQVAATSTTTFAPRTSLAFNEYGHGFPAIAYITNGGTGTGSLFFTVDPPSLIPEPGALVLCVTGFAIAATTRRRRGQPASSPRA